jgi:chromosome segregation protein
MENYSEGYSKAVKLVMGEAGRGSLRGIHGPVAGLLRVSDQYAVAVETALGGAMQHIVVETEQDAKAAIQALKRRDGGRATFLPISSIRPAELRDQGDCAGAGFVGVGKTLIDFDEQYRNIFANLLGRVVSPKTGRRRRHREEIRLPVRVVTLEGRWSIPAAP